MTDDKTESTDGPDKKKDYKELLTSVTDRAKEFEDKYWKEGRKIYSIFTGRQDGISFNILYSNTETIVPAMFSKKPLARVWRRFDEDRADIPAKILQRMLTFCMDTNLSKYPDFMTACEDSVLDAALPGVGTFRVRNVDGLAVLDYVAWDKYVWGYCPRWETRPWEAFAHDMPAEDILAEFKDDLTEGEIAIFKAKSGTVSNNTEGPTDTDKQTGEKKPDTVRVWEVWNKKTKERHWLCEAAENCCLKSDTDPLGLENFFPTPAKPLTFVHSTTDTIPVPIYKEYQQQAEELNEITRRLTQIVKAIKVRGIYASNIDDIPKVFEETNDNVLIPSQAAFNVLAQGKGLDAFIWLLPIDKLMMAAKELYEARDRVKQTIYEILGIGDILRGVSKASETLGAQQLKDKWGGLRINKSRQRVADFIRDGLRLLAECAIKNTPPELWMEITGVQLMDPQQTAIATTLAQQSQKPPPPPNATWEGVLGMLKKNISRAYLVDIETNSSVDSEATQEKAEMAEFMNALGQAMAGLKEIMMTGPQGWEAGKQILLGILGKFDMGEEVATVISKLPPPQQQDPKQLAKMLADIQKKSADLAKQEQANKEDTATFKTMLDDAKRAAEDIQRQKDELTTHTQMRVADIQIAQDKAIIAIDREMLKLAGAQQAAEKAVANAGLASGKAKLDQQGARQAQQTKKPVGGQ